MTEITDNEAPYEVILCEGQDGISRISAQSRIFLNRKVKDSDNIPMLIKKEQQQTQASDTRLGEWLATGICGNNITSSALYVVALCAAPAGKYAPVALAVIAGLLYLFRRIYEEVVTALPVNGGTYNLLLNTTTKANASIAACLTMLSYVVTAVISATSAMRYIHTLCEGSGCVAIGPDTNTSVIFTTLITLSFAGLLSIMGISESAIVALLIFLFHMASMFLLVVTSLYTAIVSMPTMSVYDSHGTSATLAPYNYSLAASLLPDDTSSCECINTTAYNMIANNVGTVSTEIPMLVYNWVYTTPAMGIGGAIFFGYSSALLGISGFESSSNYVENQKPGVFPKTLRNMWVAVTFINPSIALLAQCLLPVDVIAGQAEEGALLSLMADRAAGNWLKVWIVIDATLVLVGAVITGFVGFTGLVHRMTVDRCLPQGFLVQNECRQTRHYIIGFYWFLTSALVLYTWGNVEVLAGVYTVAFLSVMFSFTVGNMLLKLRRSTLPTPVHVEWSIVLLANVCVAAGLIGNVISRPRSLPSLLIFGAVFILPVQIMLNRVKFLQIIRAITTGVTSNFMMNSSFNSPDMKPMVTHGKNGKNSSGSLIEPLNLGKSAMMSSLEEQKKSFTNTTSASTAATSSGDLTESKASSSSEGGEKKNEKNDKNNRNDNDKNGKKDGGSDEDENDDDIQEQEQKRSLSNTSISSECSNGSGNEAKAKAAATTAVTKSKSKVTVSRSLLKRSMSDANRMDRVFLDCVKSVRELLDSDRATLWLIDYHNGVLWSKVAEGIPHIRVPMDKGIVGWVCTNGETLNIPDAYKDKRFNSGVDKKTGYTTKTILCAPILVEVDVDVDKKHKRKLSTASTSSVTSMNSTHGGSASGGATKRLKMVGLIQVINKNGPAGVHFTTHDIRVLEDFCSSISLAVDKVQREDLTGDVLRRTLMFLRKQMINVRAQLRAVRLVAPRRHLERLIEESVLTAQRLLDASRSHLWLVDRTRNELWTNTTTQIAPLRIKMGEGIIGKIADNTMGVNGECVIVNNLWSTINLKKSIKQERNINVGPKDIKTEHILCCAVRSVTGELVGVIQVVNKMTTTKKNRIDTANQVEEEKNSEENNDKNIVTFDDDDASKLSSYCLQLGHAVERILQLGTMKEVPASALRSLTLEVAAMKAQLYTSYQDLFLQGNRTACELYVHIDCSY
jgi:hypothetical protein